MEQPRQTTVLQSPKFQVIATWVWNGIAAIIVMGLVAVLLPDNIAINRDAMRQQPELALIPIVTEIIAVGLLPIVFSILNKDKAESYGLSRKGLVQSIALSALVLIVYLAAISINAGQVTTGITLSGVHFSKPLNLLFAVLAILAYGPLEVFFVIWLIHNTDRIFNSEAPILSRGLIVTIVIYGLLHTFSQGLHSLVIAAIFLALGLIFKYTRNAIGPMIAWTIINEYAWFLVSVFLAQA